MDSKRALRWSGYYFLLTVVTGAVGLALVAVGLAGGGVQAFEAYQSSGVIPALGSAAPWLVPVLLGVAIWRFGKAWAFYWTLTAAVEDELSETYDTERLKSDVLAVLDERLADMQQDVQSMNRTVRELKVEESGTGFEFDD